LGAQGVQLVPPPPLYVPAGQSLHDSVAAVAKVPGGQLLMV
jgi:hypothetical protein